MKLASAVIKFCPSWYKGSDLVNLHLSSLIRLTSQLSNSNKNRLQSLSKSFSCLNSAKLKNGRVTEKEQPDEVADFPNNMISENCLSSGFRQGSNKY